MEVRGRGEFVLKEKFTLLKERLEWWNKEIFGKYNLEVEEGVRDLETLAINRNANKRIWLNLMIKENILIQKSRLKWLNDGDSNSKFFHRVMKERRRRNHISSVVCNIGVLNLVKDVRKAVKDHFKRKFVDYCIDRPTLEGVDFNLLSLNRRLSLEVPFSEEEIKEAVWRCDGSKSAGPDDMSLLFIKNVGTLFIWTLRSVFMIFIPDWLCLNLLLPLFLL